MVTERGELYAATVIDFSGRDPVIYRSLGNMAPLRTAQYNSKWLNGKEPSPPLTSTRVCVASPTSSLSALAPPLRASLRVRLRDRTIRLLLPEGDGGGKRLRQDCVLSRGEGL